MQNAPVKRNFDTLKSNSSPQSLSDVSQVNKKLRQTPPAPNMGGQFLPPIQGPQVGAIQQAPQIQQPPQVQFRIDERGKVRYHARDDSNTRASSTYVTMSPHDFAHYKNAGKRYKSEKWTDMTTMQSYVRDNSGQFFMHQKGSDPKGQIAPNQNELNQRFSDGLMLDRSRKNRIGQSLEPFDLGHYKSKPNGSRMDVLSGKKENFKANRDHVVSGESLKRRAKNAGLNPNAAYKEGLTIAIPNDYMHKRHSPTFGGRQGSQDTVDGKKAPRVQHDTVEPGLAFHRDVTQMLDRTQGQNLGPRFDMSQSDNKMKQHGAYRKMFKESVKMNANDSSRGFNPSGSGFDLQHVLNPKKQANIGTFTSTKNNSTTIGKQMANSLMAKL